MPERGAFLPGGWFSEGCPGRGVVGSGSAGTEEALLPSQLQLCDPQVEFSNLVVWVAFQEGPSQSLGPSCHRGLC